MKLKPVATQRRHHYRFLEELADDCREFSITNAVRAEATFEFFSKLSKRDVSIQPFQDRVFLLVVLVVLLVDRVFDP